MDAPLDRNGYGMAIKSFQVLVGDWFAACFAEPLQWDRQERTHRFLEESLELAQANGCSRDEALMLVNYVFSRPQGESEQEVGGVMVTLAGLCNASQIDMCQAANSELERNWVHIETIRRKQASRPHGSPLPQ